MKEFEGLSRGCSLVLSDPLPGVLFEFLTMR
nr:MAG TPA: hypothetical protein [Bacteriophage sp.]